MALKEQLAEDLKTALKAGDERRKSAIRMATAAVRNAEIAAGAPLDDAGVISVLTKEVRQRRESIEEFKKGNRPDLVQKEEEELAFLLAYMPQQLSREEIVSAAKEVIAQVGARGPADKGKVMPVIIERLRGRADGREINQVVTELLAQG